MVCGIAVTICAVFIDHVGWDVCILETLFLLKYHVNVEMIIISLPPRLSFVVQLVSAVLWADVVILGTPSYPEALFVGLWVGGSSFGWVFIVVVCDMLSMFGD